MNEKKNYPHIYIDLSNHIHVLVPIVYGNSISIHNTCQTFNALNDFRINIIPTINGYIQDLKMDLALRANESQKSRLNQLQMMKAAVTASLNDPELYERVWRNFPRGIQLAMAQNNPNLVGILLAPPSLHAPLRIPHYLCSFNRNLSHTFASELQRIIIPAFGARRDMLITSAIGEAADAEKIVSTQEVFNQLKQRLQQAANNMGLTIDFDKGRSGQQLDADQILSNFLVLEEDTLSNIAEAILHSVSSPEGLDHCECPFEKIAKLEKQVKGQQAQFSIAVQLLIAHFNAFCSEHNLTTTDFGKIIDGSPSIKQGLISELERTLSNNSFSIHYAVFSYINSCSELFGITNPLEKEALETIYNRFKQDYNTIYADTSDTRYYDEFMLLLPNKGDFYSYRSSFVLPFSTFLRYQDPHLYTQYFDQSAIMTHTNVKAPNANDTQTLPETMHRREIPTTRIVGNAPLPLGLANQEGPIQQRPQLRFVPAVHPEVARFAPPAPQTIRLGDTPYPLGLANQYGPIQRPQPEVLQAAVNFNPQYSHLSSHRHFLQKILPTRLDDQCKKAKRNQENIQRTLSEIELKRDNAYKEYDSMFNLMEDEKQKRMNNPNFKTSNETHTSKKKLSESFLNDWNTYKQEAINLEQKRNEAAKLLEIANRPKENFAKINASFKKFCVTYESNFYEQCVQEYQRALTRLVGEDEETRNKIVEQLSLFPNSQFERQVLNKVTTLKKEQLKQLPYLLDCYLLAFSERVKTDQSTTRPCRFLRDYPIAIDRLLQNEEFITYMQVLSGFSEILSPLIQKLRAIQSDIHTNWDLEALEREDGTQNHHNQTAEIQLINSKRKFKSLVDQIFYIIDHHIDTNTYTLGYLDAHAINILNHCYEELVSLDWMQLQLMNIDLTSVCEFLHGASLFSIPETVKITSHSLPHVPLASQIHLTTGTTELSHNNPLIFAEQLPHTMNSASIADNICCIPPIRDGGGDFVVVKKDSALANCANSKQIMKNIYKSTMLKLAENGLPLRGVGTTLNAVLTTGKNVVVANVGDTMAFLIIQKKDDAFITVRLSDIHGVLHHRQFTHKTTQVYFDASCARNMLDINTCGIEIDEKGQLHSAKIDFCDFNLKMILTMLSLSEENIKSTSILQLSDGVISLPDYYCDLEENASSTHGVENKQVDVSIKGIKPYKSSILFRGNMSIGHMSDIMQQYYKNNGTLNGVAKYMVDCSQTMDDKTAILIALSSPTLSVVCDTHSDAPKMQNAASSTQVLSPIAQFEKIVSDSVDREIGAMKIQRFWKQNHSSAMERPSPTHTANAS